MKVACARREIDRTDHDKEQQRSTCVAPCTQEDDESPDAQFEGVLPAVIQGVFLRVRSRKDLPPKISFSGRLDPKQTLKKAGCSLGCVCLSGLGLKKTLDKAGCSLDRVCLGFATKRP